MNVAKLPVHSAAEPVEEAKQPAVDKEDDHSETIGSIILNSTAHMNVLSQPPKRITHKQKLLWLQQRRTEGLWAQCDDCDRWRYLPRVLDRHELPVKWYCWMNPDTSLATCLAPEVPICLYDEDDLIHAEYAAGSLVLARMPGFPWWPAMVCDCPDTEQYYWLDGFSDIPTYYNVVFFDACDVLRAWIAPEQLMPYKSNNELLKKLLKIKNFKVRLHKAITQANDAQELPLSVRLAKYSFIARYNGKIGTPKKIKKHEAIRYRNTLKRKFNIADLSDESLSSEEELREVEKNRANKKKILKKLKKKHTKSESNIHTPETDKRISIKNIPESLNNTKELNSLAVQVDSDSAMIKSIINETSSNDKEQETNIISDTLVTETLSSQNATTLFSIEEDSEQSNSFDF